MYPSFRIGDWHVDPNLCLIQKGGAETRLEPRVMDVLLFFARRPGELVSRAEIVEEIWGGPYVVDESLLRCISVLRKSLGDNPRAPVYIETIPKRGYRLIAECDLPDREAGGSVERRDSRWRSGTNLPVTAGNPEPKSRAALAFGAAAAAIVLVAITLISVGKNDEAYFAGSPSTLTAQRYYELAEDHYYGYKRDSNENAVELYRKALARNPEHSRAYAGLANALAQKYHRWGGQEADIEDAITMARASVRLSPESAESHKALGLALEYGGDLDAANNAYYAAVEIDPGYWPALGNIGDLRFARGFYSEALDWYSRAARSEPENVAMIVRVGRSYSRLGEFEQAGAWYRRALELKPMDDLANAGLARIHLSRNDPVDAIKQCSVVINRTDIRNACALVTGEAALHQGQYERAVQYFDASKNRNQQLSTMFHVRNAQAQLVSGDRKAAEDKLEQLLASLPDGERCACSRLNWTRAVIHALLDNVEQAFESLELASEYDAWDYYADTGETAFASLREDPRFQAYLDTLKAKIASQASGRRIGKTVAANR